MLDARKGVMLHVLHARRILVLSVGCQDRCNLKSLTPGEVWCLVFDARRGVVLSVGCQERFYIKCLMA